MKQQAQEHKTMFIVAQKMRIAQRLPDRVFFMDKGAMDKGAGVEDNPPGVISIDPQNERRRNFLRKHPEGAQP